MHGFLQGRRPLALPALWLCVPGEWGDPYQYSAPRAENTGGLCLLRVGEGWPPSGVCRNPGRRGGQGRIGGTVLGSE